MKKILATFFCVTYLISTNICYAYSSLFYLTNTNTSTVQSKVESNYLKQKYTIYNRNPYYGKSNITKTDYAITVLEQSGANMFLYYESNNNRKIEENILKDLKKIGIKYKESQDTSLITKFMNIAQNAKNSTNTSKYNFSTPATTNVSTSSDVSTSTTLKGYVGQVAKGTTLHCYIQAPINTETSSKGDQIIAILTQDWLYNNQVIASQGSTLNGTLTKAKSATYGCKNGHVRIDFTTLTTPDGKVYKLSTENIDFVANEEGKATQNAVKIATGAASGALVGGLASLLSSSSNAGTSAAVGAGIGAGLMLIGVLAQKGIDAEIPALTEIEVSLKKPLNVVLSY